jgi:hypothetical protein
MQKKFRGLAFIGLLLKIIGVLELIVGLSCLIIVPLVMSDSNSSLYEFGYKTLFPGSGVVIGLLVGSLIFLIGLVCGLLTFSAGEIFNVLISIEENTRASMILLQKTKQSE